MNLALKDIVFIIFRYKLVLVLFSVYLCIALGIYLVGAKRVYESRAEVLVRFGQEQLGSMTLSSTARNVYFTRREEEIQNEIRILTSNDSLMAVAVSIAGPQASHSEVLQLREYLSINLAAKSVKNSDLISVSFFFPDPQVAQKVLMVLLEQYQRHHGKVYFDDNEEKLLLTSLNSARSGYSRALEALSSFERTHHVFDDRQLVLLNETREQQQLALNALTNEYAYTKRKRDQLQEVISGLPQQVLFSSREVLNERHSKLSERLAQAYVDKENLLRRYKPDSRPVLDLDKEIALLKVLLQKEPQRQVDDKENRRNEAWEALNKQLLELTPEVEGQLARIESLRRQVSEIDDALARAAEVKGEHSLLVRDMELTKGIYDKYHQDYAEALGRTTARQQSITNVSVVESPSFNQMPTKPASRKIMAFGIVLLVVGNASLLMFSMLFDKTVSLPSQAQSIFNLPVLGVFSRGEQRSVNGRLPFYESQKAEFRKLFLKLTSGQEPWRSILFTSVDYIDPFSSPAEAFASFVLRYQQKSAVLIRYTSSDAAQAQNGTTAAPQTNPAGLHIYDRSAAHSAGERAFWDWLKEGYEMLIFDYSPLQENALLIEFADYTDKVLFTVQAEQSNKYVVNHTLDMMRQYGLNTVGLVLNGRQLHIPQSIYRYL